MSDHTSYAQLFHASTGSVRVGPGDIVGRMRSAAMRIDNPHVSEAHAYVSLRDGALKLLALRGGLAVAGRLVREVTLAPGVQIALAKDHFLSVESVRNPEKLLALKGPGLEPEVLTGRSLSVVHGPTPRVEGRILPDAALILWTDGAGWMARIGSGAPRPLEPGDTLEVEGAVYEAVEVSALGGDAPATALAGRLDQPLQLRGFYDACHVHRQGLPPLVLGGAAGRLLCELGAIGQPVHWRDVAQILWPADDDGDRLRKRWDVMLIRLRKRLAQASVRTTLVQADGTGNVQLLLTPLDQFTDLG